MAHSIEFHSFYDQSNICYLDRFHPVWVDSFGNLRKIQLGEFHVLDINFLYFRKETDPVLFGRPALVREFTTYHMAPDLLQSANDDLQVSPEEVFEQLPQDLKESQECFYYATEPKNIPAPQIETKLWREATTRIFSVRNNTFSSVGR